MLNNRLQGVSGVNLVWNLGGHASGSKIFIFPSKFPKNSDFSDNLKKIEFPDKNSPFTATFTPWQIILFLFKSQHFRTYFLYMIRYNNISRPPCDPPRPLCSKSGGRDPLNPLGLTPLQKVTSS